MKNSIIPTTTTDTPNDEENNIKKSISIDTVTTYDLSTASKSFSVAVGSPHKPLNTFSYDFQDPSHSSVKMNFLNPQLTSSSSSSSVQKQIEIDQFSSNNGGGNSSKRFLPLSPFTSSRSTGYLPSTNPTTTTTTTTTNIAVTSIPRSNSNSMKKSNSIKNKQQHWKNFIPNFFIRKRSQQRLFPSTNEYNGGSNTTDTVPPRRTSISTTQRLVTSTQSSMFTWQHLPLLMKDVTFGNVEFEEYRKNEHSHSSVIFFHIILTGYCANLLRIIGSNFDSNAFSTMVLKVVVGSTIAVGWIYICLKLFLQSSLSTKMSLKFTALSSWMKGYVSKSSKDAKIAPSQERDLENPTQPQEQGKQKEKSSAFLHYFELMWLIITTLTFNMYLMTLSYYISHSELQPEDSNLNFYASNKRMPEAIVILCMMQGLVFYIVVKGLAMRTVCISVIATMLCNAITMVYLNLLKSIPVVVLFAPFSMFLLFEYHRQNFSAFLLLKKVQDVIEENKILAEDIKSNELRHVIGNVAHDLKTPLSSIINGMDVIHAMVHDSLPLLSSTSSNSTKNSQSEDSIRDKLNSALEIVQNVTNTNQFMMMTINRCIDYSRSVHGIKLIPLLEPVKLSEVLQFPIHCLQDLQSKIPIHILPLPNSLQEYISTDKQWLQENLLCLLGNAVKYSSKGPVTLKLTLIKKRVAMVFTDVSLDSSHLSQDGNEEEGDKNSHSISTSTKQVSTSSKVVKMIGDEEKSYKQRTRTSPRQVKNQYKSSSSSSKQYKSEVCHFMREYLKIEIEDDGPGIVSENNSIFQEPKQAARLSGGTGLGLYALARRIDTLDGDYGVNKRTNGERGSCFWFSIPYEPMQDKAMQLLKTAKESISSSLANQNSVSVVVEGGESTNNSTALISSPRVIRSANIESNIGIGSGGYFKEPLRVLVVEDSMVISKMIKLLLTRHGHVVFTAENGQEAVNFIRDQPSQDETNPYKTNVDIILMDFQMPIMGGIEATRLIRQWEAKQLGFAHNDVLPYQPPNNFHADGSNSSSIEQRLLSEASNTACGPSHKRRLSRVRTSFQTQLSPVEEYLPTSSQGGGGGGGIANGDNSVRSSSRSAGSSSGTGSGSYRKGNNANSNSNAILSAMEQAVKNVEKDELTVVDIESNPSQQIVTASPKHSFGLSGIQEEENEFMSPPSNRSQPHKSISTASVVHHGNTMSSFAALENHIHPSQANTTNNNASFSVDQKYLLINRTPTMRSSAMFTSATTLRSDSGFFNGSMPSFLAPGSYPTSENLPSGEVASSSDKTSDLNHGERSKQFIKIIGFSAKSDYEVINEGYIAGMDAFIAKPFAIKSFYETYAQLCIQDLR